MAKFYGTIGYSKKVKTSGGVYSEFITEKNYCGDVIRNSRHLQAGDSISDNITVNNQISILADPFAYENFHSMAYIQWMGTRWKIIDVDVRSPRLILSIGGVYNGKTGPTPSNS